MVSSLSNSFSMISLPKACHANAFCFIIIHSFINWSSLVIPSHLKWSMSSGSSPATRSG